MTRERLRGTYTSRIAHFSEAIHRHTRIINILSLLRLLSLVALVYLLVLGIRDAALHFYLLAGVMAALFLTLVLWFNRQKEKRELLRQMRSLNETELACLDHRFDHLPDGGRYSDHAHPWSNDLDIFGKGSLYQYLNRTSTLKGSDILAKMLTSEPPDTEMIRMRQGITDDLKERIDFRQEFTARGRLINEKEDDLRDISVWLDVKAYITKQGWLYYLALSVTLLSLSVLVAGLFNHAIFWFLLAILAINFVILSPFLMRTNRYQASVSKKHGLLEGYAGLLKLISAASFEHPELTGRKEQAKEGMKEVKRLSRLLNLFDQRMSMLIGPVFNGLFLFDFHMLHLLERWKRRNRKQIMEWIWLTGWIDAMTSLAGFAYNHPEYALPGWNGPDWGMELKGLGHPLIPDEKRVVNNLRIDGEKVVIITGANMAGKSTFLRSLGVNMVLAYAGCPVCATSFRTGLMGLYSSMRTSDSLADEESYFLAEIRRLHLIVSRMELGRPLMILLDEVLKGTNTTDKKKGSVGLILRSLQYPVRCFIATHDLSLGELEKDHPAEIANYCFESYIRELELQFDYTIRRGIATNMNATFLMKQMGIMD